MKNFIVAIFTLILINPFNTFAFDKQKLDTFLDSLEHYNKLMGSIAIHSGDEVVFQRAIGYVDAENKIKANKDSKYRIGSISKTFTSVMIFKLIESGNLSLQNKLADFFPSVPNAELITVEDLLYHQSGIYNFTAEPDYTTWNVNPMTRNELLEKISSYDPVFKPGRMNSYSNSGYVLLSFIIEDVTGKKYSEALQEMICKPLGLKNTYHGKKINTDANEVFSYTYGNGIWHLEQETDMSIPMGGGSIVSTSGDLVIFFDALFEGKLVSMENLERMKEMKNNYGAGLFSYPFYDKTTYGHTGGIDGFRSMAVRFPEDDVTVALVSNGMNYDQNQFMIDAMKTFFDMEFDMPEFKKNVILDAKLLEKYSGDWTSETFPLDVKIFVENGTLKAMASGQTSFPLSPLSSTEFEFTPASVEIKFIEEDNKLQMVMNQFGTSHKFDLK